MPTLSRRAASILATRDGGASWSEIAIAPDARLRWIGFSRKAGVAYATDGIGLLFYSRDGGRTWTEDSVPPPGKGKPKRSLESAALTQETRR